MQERFDKALGSYQKDKNDISLWTEFSYLYRTYYDLRKKILPILFEIKSKNMDLEFIDFCRIHVDLALLKKDNPEDIETQTMLQTLLGNNVYVHPIGNSTEYYFDADLLE